MYKGKSGNPARIRREVRTQGYVTLPRNRVTGCLRGKNRPKASKTAQNVAQPVFFLINIELFFGEKVVQKFWRSFVIWKNNGKVKNHPKSED
jgi:hypothetical protein